MFPKTAQLKERHDEIVEVIRANPQITPEGIFRILKDGAKYQTKHKQRLNNSLIDLAIEKRIRCINVNEYIAIEEK